MKRESYVRTSKFEAALEAWGFCLCPRVTGIFQDYVDCVQALYNMGF